MEHPGVWCCEHRFNCNWQGINLHQGLGWGTIPPEHSVFRKWHDKECGGKLIQLVEPSKDDGQGG